MKGSSKNHDHSQKCLSAWARKYGISAEAFDNPLWQQFTTMRPGFDGN